MKKCFKCGIKKELVDFYSHRMTSDGLLGKCKDCTKKDVSSSKVNYDKTEKGVLRVIYKTQKSNSKKREFCEVLYSKEEFVKWMYKNNYKFLYDKWVESGYEKDKKPSVDRLNDFKGYSFDNIRLVTWMDNRKKQYEDIRNGVGTGGLRVKALYKFSKYKNIISIYVSYSSAVRDVGYSLEYQIKNKKTCRNGFFWSYSPFFGD